MASELNTGNQNTYNERLINLKYHVQY